MTQTPATARRAASRQIGALAALIAAAAATLPAGAQDTDPKAPPVPSAEKGSAIAVRLCSNCHFVEGKGDASSVPAGIPSLKGLANQPGQSSKRIENALIAPHAPMPDLRLTIEEIQHILAYLETLRTNPEVPPLQQAPADAKPKYPKPS